MDTASMDRIFQALAHSTRRYMLDLVKNTPGIAVGTLAAEFDVSRIAVMKHLKILEDADLILSQKDGRSRHLFFNAVPIQMIHDRWTSDYSAYWAGNITRIKYIAETNHHLEKKNKTKGTRKNERQ